MSLLPDVAPSRTSCVTSVGAAQTVILLLFLLSELHSRIGTYVMRGEEKGGVTKRGRRLRESRVEVSAQQRQPCQYMQAPAIEAWQFFASRIHLRQFSPQAIRWVRGPRVQSYQQLVCASLRRHCISTSRRSIPTLETEPSHRVAGNPRAKQTSGRENVGALVGWRPEYRKGRVSRLDVCFFFAAHSWALRKRGRMRGRRPSVEADHCRRQLQVSSVGLNNVLLVC